MIDPEISVIVPVYNAQDFLEDCINSILAQTYQSFELILVDDGSTDRSSEICDQYVHDDVRVQVIHQTNQGQSAARNRALRIAQGNWICFVDSDDLIHPRMLELLYNAAHNGSVNMSMCGYVEAEAVPADFYSDHENSFQTVDLNETALVEMYNRNQYPSWVACFKLIRKEIILQHLFTEGRIFEDNAVVCKWVYLTAKAAVVPYPLYFYRVNPNGTTKRAFNLKHLDYLWALKEIISFFTEVQYTTLRSIFCNEYVLSASSFYRAVINQLNRKDIAKQIKHDLLCMMVQYKNDIKLSPEKRAEVIGNLHPKIMPVYWRIEQAYLILKQDGIAALTKKIFEHLK